MKRRILVVEDDAHLADGLRINLNLEGYEPVMAGSAARTSSMRGTTSAAWAVAPRCSALDTASSRRLIGRRWLTPER